VCGKTLVKLNFLNTIFVIKDKSSRLKVQSFFKSNIVSMATVKRFEDLEIWQMAREQANSLWKIYTESTFSKDFELRNQISRSSGSVMDNIAEGFERSGNKEFINFLIIAKASNGEVRSQLYRAFDRNHVTKQMFETLISKTENLSKN
jgi:four helix bundle protein